MWCSLFTILVAVFDLCALMKHVTMFLSWDVVKGMGLGFRVEVMC